MNVKIDENLLIKRVSHPAPFTREKYDPFYDQKKYFKTKWNEKVMEYFEKWLTIARLNERKN